MINQDGALATAIREIGSHPDNLMLLRRTDRGDVFSFPIETERALELWKALRERAEETGYWPVIVDSGFCEELRETQEQGELGEDFAVAEHFNVAAWFEETKSDLVAAGVEEEDWGEDEEDEDDESLDPETGCPLGQWPEVPQPINDFVILNQQSTDLASALVPKSTQLALALIPTKLSWNVPIYLSFGGWNACPEPGVIAGLLRYWLGNWQAELVAITFDTLELRVGQPPQDREAALKLAQEQYLVCQDIVDQGVESLNALAAGLLGGSAWYFWWD